MVKIRFWLRAPNDKRPLSLLIKDTPCELDDWEEVATGVYPIPGLHNNTAASVMVQRDLTNPVWVINEIMRIMINTPLLLAQAKDKTIAHVELVTDKGPVTLLSEIGDGLIAAQSNINESKSRFSFLSARIIALSIGIALALVVLGVLVR